MTACLPDHNLCTPERLVVPLNGTKYHFVLSANLAWAAAIPNPHGREVVITETHGVACWT